MAGQFWLLDSALLSWKPRTLEAFTHAVLFINKSTIVYTDLYQRDASSRVNKTLALFMVPLHCKRCVNAIGKRKIIYDKNQPSKKK